MRSKCESGNGFETRQVRQGEGKRRGAVLATNRGLPAVRFLRLLPAPSRRPVPWAPGESSSLRSGHDPLPVLLLVGSPAASLRLLVVADIPSVFVVRPAPSRIQRGSSCAIPGSTRPWALGNPSIGPGFPADRAAASVAVRKKPGLFLEYGCLRCAILSQAPGASRGIPGNPIFGQFLCPLLPAQASIHASPIPRPSWPPGFLPVCIQARDTCCACRGRTCSRNGKKFRRKCRFVL